MMSADAFSPRKLLTEALDLYRGREAAGHDLAEAGQELAYAVRRSLGPPPPCAPPRLSLLETIPLNRDVEDLESIMQLSGLSDKAGHELTESERELVRAIEERIRELQSPEWQRANPEVRGDPWDEDFKPVFKSAEDYESLLAKIKDLQGLLSETVVDLRDRLSLADPDRIVAIPLDLDELDESGAG